MLLLLQFFLVELILTENTPLVRTDQELESGGVVNELIQIFKPPLAHLHGDLDDLVLNPSFDFSILHGCRLPQLSNVPLKMALCLDGHELLSEVILLLSEGKVVAARVEGLDVDIVKPNQIFEVVHETNLRGDGLGLGEVVDQLLVGQLVVVDVLRSERPLEVEAGRINVLVLNPASLPQSLLQIAVASRHNEYLLAVLHLELFLPRLHIGDVRKHLQLGHVSLHEGFEVGLDELFLCGLLNRFLVIGSLETSLVSKGGFLGVLLSSLSLGLFLASLVNLKSVPLSCFLKVGHSLLAGFLQSNLVLLPLLLFLLLLELFLCSHFGEHLFLLFSNLTSSLFLLASFF